MKDDYVRFRLTTADKETLRHNMERDGYETMSRWLVDAIRTVRLHRPPVVPVVDTDSGASRMIATGDGSQNTASGQV